MALTATTTTTTEAPTTAPATSVDPMLIEVPERLETERLILRCLQPGDGAVVNAGVCASLDALRPYMPWAQSAPPLEESESMCRRAQANFRLREDLVYAMFLREAGAEGDYIGGCGLHRIDWTVRRFEIGYWRRTGYEHKGYVTEAAQALVRLCFDTLAARRVELRMDARNEPSWKVAERAGFTYEGTLRGNTLTPGGEPRDTRIYARVRGFEEPA